MDVSSGRLIALTSKLRDVPAELPPGYDRVPPELEKVAMLKLAGRPEAQVNLRGNTPLAKWAKQKRKEKIAAKSRRRNRK